MLNMEGFNKRSTESYAAWVLLVALITVIGLFLLSTPVQAATMSKSAFLKEAKKLYYYEDKCQDRYWRYYTKYPTRAVSTIVWQVDVNLDLGFFNKIEAVKNPSSITALVNKNFKLSSNFVPSLKRIDSASLRPEAVTALAELKKAAAKNGIYVYAYSNGYRSYSTQNSIYKSKSAATRDQWSARPGHSEHQLGLAVDMTNSRGSMIGNGKEGTWLKNNSWKYGFIVRYTKENTGITGYNSEPWHIRYIGKADAQRMHDLNYSSYEEYWVKYVAHRPTSSSAFRDVDESHPYFKQINTLYKKGIVSGFGDGSFGVGQPVIRQQFAKMILDAIGEKPSESDMCKFTDVKHVDGDLYPYHYVAKGVALGIIKGQTATKFAPSAKITRAQVISMIARTSKVKELPAPPKSYKPPFPKFTTHYESARLVAYHGLLKGLQGYGKNYNFSAYATRGEVAVMLYNLSQKKK